MRFCFEQPCLLNQFRVRCCGRFQGRSSVVEQRPFKPKVVGSIPTAPTKTRRYAGIRGTTKCKSFSEAPTAGWIVAVSEGPRYTPAPFETS